MTQITEQATDDQPISSPTLSDEFSDAWDNDSWDTKKVADAPAPVEEKKDEKKI